MAKVSTIKSKGYDVVIGETALNTLDGFLAKGKYTSVFILCDENTLQHCLPVLVLSCKALAKAEVIEIESGEISKSLDICAQVIHTLAENHADRKSLVINLGGGVVSDLGGFAASIYKRGIDFVNVPTSLLAMADASVGGKTGIDFADIKNLIGTFVQPGTVIVYPGFLDTLPERHFRNGLAEIYKMALISDARLWAQLKQNGQNLNTEALITKSIGLKNKIVLSDPFDLGKRKILNFGHTIGHAIEALLIGTQHELLHGEAITHGMIIESQLAFQKKLISKPLFTEICNVLRGALTPAPLPDIPTEAVIEKLRNDKKSSGTAFSFSLPKGIGSCGFDIRITESQIKKALSFYNSWLK